MIHSLDSSLWIQIRNIFGVKIKIVLPLFFFLAKRTLNFCAKNEGFQSANSFLTQLGLVGNVTSFFQPFSEMVLSTR